MTKVLDSNLYLSKAKKYAGYRIAALAIKMCPEYFDTLVKERTEKVSMQAIVQYLDQERLLHCSICTRRYSLRKLNGVLYCAHHYYKTTDLTATNKLGVLTK